MLLCQSFPNCCQHHIMIAISVSSPERSYIEYTRMPSPIYQYVINQAARLPSGRGPGVFTNVSVREIRVLNNSIFLCCKIYYSNITIIIILMYPLIPNCRFENIISHNFALNFPNRIVHMALGKIFANMLQFLIKTGP